MNITQKCTASFHRLLSSDELGVTSLTFEIVAVNVYFTLTNSAE